MKPEKRNRHAEVLAAGRLVRSFEIGMDTAAAIDRTVAHFTVELGRCSRSQALEWLVRQGVKKIPK